jgi:ribonuclease P/MRP protein subunit RPP40
VKDWVSAWLRDRFQRTRINGVSSCWRRVSSGVPQGSVLGPILFLLYINDLECGVMSWVLKFADDTKIFRRITSRVDNAILQDDLDKLVAGMEDALQFAKMQSHALW